MTRLGLAGRVLLLGERRDVPRLDGRARRGVLKFGLGEALSLALIEALACGVPCVVTDVGDSARLAGPAGVAVPARDPAAFARALQQLLAAGPATLAALGHLARQRRSRVPDSIYCRVVCIRLRRRMGGPAGTQRSAPRSRGFRAG